MRKTIVIILFVLLVLCGCEAENGEEVLTPYREEVITESEDISFSGSDIFDEKEDVVDTIVDNVEKPKTEVKAKKETEKKEKPKTETVSRKVGKEVVSSGSKSESAVEEEVSTEKESVENNPETSTDIDLKETPAETPETPVEEPEKEAPKVEEKPKSAYDYDFDISKIRADCIAVGKSMGLKVDSSLSPGTSTWWNPVTASESNQGTKLKNRLESYIRFHTPKNLSAYGIDEINYFNIYTEQVGEGKYLIYFLFA